MKGFNMFKSGDFSNLLIHQVKGKKIFVVDKHQYTLALWGSMSQLKDESFVLVSIDYHPDTQPAFWQKSYYQCIKENYDEDKMESCIRQKIKKNLQSVNPYKIESLVKVSDELNNDEHIYTALALGYLSDYHMINCMDLHKFSKGTHYLVSQEHFSSLEDTMFRSIGFKMPEKPFILDIDLDYFSQMTFDDIKSKETISKLIKQCTFITIARSHKYFEYLKKEDLSFSIDLCEEKLLNLIKASL